MVSVCTYNAPVNCEKSPIFERERNMKHNYVKCRILLSELIIDVTGVTDTHHMPFIFKARSLTKDSNFIFTAITL